MKDSIYQGRPAGRVRALLRAPEATSYFMLGEALVHAHAPPGVACSAPYVQIGMKFWKALEFELYELLCDPKTKRPKELVNTLAEGDGRDLIVGILTVLVAQLEGTLAIAVPATALVMRKRLNTLCIRKPKRPVQSAKAILAGWRRHWKENGR